MISEAIDIFSSSCVRGQAITFMRESDPVRTRPVGAQLRAPRHFTFMLESHEHLSQQPSTKAPMPDALSTKSTQAIRDLLCESLHEQSSIAMERTSELHHERPRSPTRTFKCESSARLLPHRRTHPREPRDIGGFIARRLVWSRACQSAPNRPRPVRQDCDLSALYVPTPRSLSCLKVQQLTFHEAQPHHPNRADKTASLA